MAHEPKEVVLPDSGVTVRVKFISSMLKLDLVKASKRGLTKPTPPMIEVKYSLGARLEENPEDPAYLKALQEYEQDSGARFMDKMFRYGVDYTLTEADKAKLAALRADPDLDLPADDVHAFVSRILVQSDADLEFLQAEIIGRAQPTDAQVAEKIESFPADVQAR